MGRSPGRLQKLQAVIPYLYACIAHEAVVVLLMLILRERKLSR